MTELEQPKANVYEEIERQLAWRGPSGKPQGRIVLSREHAEQLLIVPKLINLKIEEMYSALLKQMSDMTDSDRAKLKEIGRDD